MIFDWGSAAIGAGAIIVLFFILSSLKLGFKKKPKYDLYNFKKIVYDSGIKTKEVYDNLKKLEIAFKEIENV